MSASSALCMGGCGEGGLSKQRLNPRYLGSGKNPSPLSPREKNCVKDNGWERTDGAITGATWLIGARDVSDKLTPLGRIDSDGGLGFGGRGCSEGNDCHAEVDAWKWSVLLTMTQPRAFEWLGWLKVMSGKARSSGTLTLSTYVTYCFTYLIDREVCLLQIQILSYCKWPGFFLCVSLRVQKCFKWNLWILMRSTFCNTDYFFVWWDFFFDILWGLVWVSCKSSDAIGWFLCFFLS
jgi:hypothetical protein